MSSPADVPFALVGIGIALANVVLFIAIVYLRLLRPPREASRRVEVIVRSVFAGDVVHEERIMVDGASDEPVELSFVLDEQMREYL
jgi:hypothetical protein